MPSPSPQKKLGPLPGPTSSPMHPASPSARLRGARDLDDSDVRLIELLTDDGRMSIRDLSQRMALTETTVTARLRSLTRRNIMRVRAVVDWRCAGYTYAVAIFIRVRGRTLGDVIADLYLTPEVQSISRVFGSVDLIARILVANASDVATFIDNTLHNIAGAETVTTLIEVETVKYLSTFHSVSVDTTHDLSVVFPNPPIPLDALDMTIIGALVDDARQSWRLIAEGVEASETTVRSRARRIEDSGLIKVMAQIDSRQAGLPLRLAWIGLQVVNTELTRTIQYAAERPEISIVARTIGGYDILLFAAVPSHTELADLLDQLRGHPGVTASETWLVSTMSMPAFPWGVLDQ
jgi:DNA-binding Lrp family transcriptional regulator